MSEAFPFFRFALSDDMPDLTSQLGDSEDTKLESSIFVVWHYRLGILDRRFWTKSVEVATQSREVPEVEPWEPG